MRRYCLLLMVAACGPSPGAQSDRAADGPTGSTDQMQTTGVSGVSGVSGPLGVSGVSGSVWRPAPGTTWQWQISGTVDPSVAVTMYDVDLFDTPQATIDSLHDAGRIVICYFSAGTFEQGARPDNSEFMAADHGTELPEWPGEFWLDTRSTNVRRIMRLRLDLAAAKHCDGVEPDNVDGYDNSPGFPLTAATQRDFNTFLASEAHERGLSIGLKNALDLVADLQPSFDWALNEECLAFAECGLLVPFIDAGKAVFHVEYVDNPSLGPAKHTEVCGDTSIAGFSTLIKTWDLDAWRSACP